MRLRQTTAWCTWIALIFAVIALSALPALASYSSDGGVTVDPTQVSAGGSITIASSGWKPASSVTVTLHSTPVVLSTETADSTGAISASETIPASTDAGSHTVVLTGTAASGSPREVSTPLTLTSSGDSSLPRTGAAIAALVVVASLLIAGGAAMSAARRRATRTTP